MGKKRHELTFGPAGVDSGTQPDQLVGFLQSEVLDAHQGPVCQTQTHTYIQARITSKAAPKPTSSPLLIPTGQKGKENRKVKHVRVRRTDNKMLKLQTCPNK